MISHQIFVRFLGSLLFLALLAACASGEGRSTTPASGKDFVGLLYANRHSTVVYYPNWNDGAHSYEKNLFQSLNIDWPNATLSLLEFRYQNNNLPQYAVHIRKDKNTKLLVYNHGHGGLPSKTELFANEFLSKAFSDGFDILFTSMPGVGINRLNPAVDYWLITYGDPRKVPLDKSIASTWPWLHYIYEVINDRDSYLHFFIDQMIILPSAMKVDGDSTFLDGRLFASELVDFPNRKYTNIYYVGLSGGGVTGLSACAIFSFDKCILVAGFLPEYLRVQAMNAWGDAEQTSRSVYSLFPYESIIDIAEKRTRKMIYVYNKYDSCCFSDPLATRFKNDFPTLDIRLTDLSYHGYLAGDIMVELKR